jgi:transposase
MIAKKSLKISAFSAFEGVDFTLKARYNYSVKNLNGINIKTQVMANGTEYVYEDTSYWDKEKKQNRHRRNYIGKIGPDGEFIPNKKHLAGRKPVTNTTIPPTANRLYWGAAHMLDEIGRITGVTHDIEVAFPKNGREMLSLAYYLVLESDSPMYRFGRWSYDHCHPHGTSITSQRASEIMRDVSEEGKMSFFRMQASRRQDKEYLAYDTTSVSSWSEYIKAVRYGKNKDGDKLPQVNMALVFGEDSALPVYYRVLPGNISDVTIVKKLLKDVSFLEIDKLKLVMDRGFYSTSNINALFKGHYKFLISVKANVGFVSEAVREAKERIHDFRHYDDEHEVYFYSVASKWPYVEKDRHKKTVKEEERRIYIHVFYNGTRAEAEKQRFAKSLTETKAAILEGRDLTSVQKDIRDSYFIVKTTPKRGACVEYRETEIKRHMDDLGYFVLLSNDVKDSRIAIETYRRKDMVEKAFDNLKERLEMRRTTVHSDETLQGRFFLQFLALIFVSYLHKHMHDKGLYRNYTMQSLMDSLDVIERFDYDGNRPHYSEITDKQRKLYECLGALLPNTL